MSPTHHKKKALASALLAFSIFAMSMVFLRSDAVTDSSPDAIANRISKHLQADTLYKQEVVAKYNRFLVLVRDEDELYDSAEEDVLYVSEKEGMRAECLYVATSDATYGGGFQSVTINESVAPGEEFEVSLTFLNTGDTPWFKNGYCSNQVEVNLATAMDYGRSSLFGTDDYAVAGWLNDSRVEMVENFVYPNEVATFKFTSKAPWGDVWYKEYFAPVAEGVKWLDEAVTPVDIKVGIMDEVDAGIMDIVTFSSDWLDFKDLGEWIHVDLSEQHMDLYAGETVIYDLPISSGAYNTPTPTGTYYILNKQELRIGGEWPHYQMPNWMGFTSSGHGLHALPYLANDNGAFWYEALSHIGTPVSHGCIRQLPDDSEKVYAFGEIGMKLVIER